MRLRFYAAVGWTILIGVACWTPRDVVQEVGEETGFLGIPHFDKLVHLGIFTGFTFLWLAASRRPRYLGVAVAGLIFAVMTELGQLIPWINRDAGLDDGLVDFVGVLAGSLAFWYAAPWLARKWNTAASPVETELEAA